jgi:hypothetical protein
MVIFKKDQFAFGLIIGLIMPVISFWGYYYWKFSLFPFKEFLYALQTNKQLITGLTIPCLLMNIIIFTLYINGQRDKTAKGIFTITLIYAITSLLFKFFA